MSSQTTGRVARQRVLPAAGFVILMVVAASGWALSYTKLHLFGVSHLDFGPRLAWLVPVVFDAAPVGLSIVVYRARLQARSAVVWRAGIWAFCALSSWINWMALTGAILEARIVGALLPIAAVVLFEGIVNETHRSAQADLFGNTVVPRLTLACWMLDRRRTFRAFKTKTLRPLAAAEEALGLPTQADTAGVFTPLFTAPVVTPDQVVTRQGGQGVSTTMNTPGVAAPAHPRAQTGRDQGEQPAVDTLVDTPVNALDGQGPRGVLTGSRLAPFDPLDMGPEAAHEQGVATRDRVIAAHAENPDASHADLADRLRVSKTTVRRYRPVGRVNGHH